MSGATIGYDVTDPADSKNLGLGAGDIRSYKTNMQGGLAAEHLWPAAGGYSGVHLAGSARAFYGTNSQVSSADTDGRLMLTSDGSRLWAVGSTATHFLGGRFTPEFAPAVKIGGSLTTSKVSQVWAIECGQAIMPLGSASTAITLQQTFVTPGAVVVLSMAKDSPALDTPILAPGAITTTFTINSFLSTHENGTSASTYTVNYIAMGFKAL